MAMADNTIYDLLDEVNCADSCEAVTALCELIDELLKDIQHLELECISTRYLLSRHMDEEQGSLLRSADCQPKRPPVPYSAATL